MHRFSDCDICWWVSKLLVSSGFNSSPIRRCASLLLYSLARQGTEATSWVIRPWCLHIDTLSAPSWSSRRKQQGATCWLLDYQRWYNYRHLDLPNSTLSLDLEGLDFQQLCVALPEGAVVYPRVLSSHIARALL